MRRPAGASRSAVGKKETGALNAPASSIELNDRLPASTESATGPPGYSALKQ